MEHKTTGQASQLGGGTSTRLSYPILTSEPLQPSTTSKKVNSSETRGHLTKAMSRRHAANLRVKRPIAAGDLACRGRETGWRSDFACWSRANHSASDWSQSLFQRFVRRHGCYAGAPSSRSFWALPLSGLSARRECGAAKHQSASPHHLCMQCSLQPPPAPCYGA